MKESPSQTAGPYVHIGCVPNFCGITGVYPTDIGAEIAGERTAGQRIALRGVVYDGEGTPLTDALIEFWQADTAGEYHGFFGFGRRAADYDSGAWTIETIKPGRVSHGDGNMAPHVLVWIVARGINTGLLTRLYFPDEDNAADPVLARIDPARRATLIAEKTGDAEYRFDIRLQGDDETVFFDS